MINQDLNKGIAIEAPKSILKKSSQFDRKPKSEAESFPWLKPVKSIRFSLDVNKKSGNSRTSANPPFNSKSNKSEKTHGKKEKPKRQRNTNADCERSRKKIESKIKLINDDDGAGDCGGVITQNQKENSDTEELVKERETTFVRKFEGKRNNSPKGAEESSRLIPSEKEVHVESTQNEKEMSLLVQDDPKIEIVNEELKNKGLCEKESEERKVKKKRKRRRRKRKRQVKE